MIPFNLCSTSRMHEPFDWQVPMDAGVLGSGTAAAVHHRAYQICTCTRIASMAIWMFCL